MMNEVQGRTASVCEPDTPSNCHSSCGVEEHDGWGEEGRAFEKAFVCVCLTKLSMRAISNISTSAR